MLIKIESSSLILKERIYTNLKYMSEQEIFDKVQTIIAEQLGVEKDQVTKDANFATDLGADSLDTVELVMAIEEAVR